MVGQPRRNFTKMASWSRASEHLVNPIGMSDQLKWNNHCTEYNINRKIIRQHCHTFFIVPYSIGKIEDEYSYNDINDYSNLTISSFLIQFHLF